MAGKGLKTDRPSPLRRALAAQPALAGKAEAGLLVAVPLQRLRPRPGQPRRHFDEESLRELAASLGRLGQLQPILVRPVPGEAGTYEIVAGERRWRAATLAGLPALQAIVSDGDPDEVALVENLQRVDLSPVEEARALKGLMDGHGYTQEQAAHVVGKTQAAVSQALRVLSLPADILDEAERRPGLASRSALLEVARAGGEAEQRALWAKLKAGTAGVRALRAEARVTQAAPAANALPGALRAVGRLEAAVEAVLLPHRGSLDERQRERLRALRRRLGEVLGE